MVDKAFDAKSKTSSVTKNLLLTMAGNARLGDTEKVSEVASLCRCRPLLCFLFHVSGWGGFKGSRWCVGGGGALNLSSHRSLCCLSDACLFLLFVLSFCHSLAQVVDAYTRMLKAKKGEIDAIVTTAEPLSPQQEKALAAGLKAQVTIHTNTALPASSYGCRRRCWRWMPRSSLSSSSSSMLALRFPSLPLSHPLSAACVWCGRQQVLCFFFELVLQNVTYLLFS